MLKFIAVLPIVFLSIACAHADHKSKDVPHEKETLMSDHNGIIQMKSDHSVKDTVMRLETALANRGVKIMGKVDHAANAAGVDISLPATTLVIFGNPAAGTQLMQASRSAAIDLPMKALVYETDDGVFLEYNDIQYIAKRHGIPADLPVLEKVSGLLNAIATEATSTNYSKLI